jgi:hypothetical protein
MMRSTLHSVTKYILQIKYTKLHVSATSGTKMCSGGGNRSQRLIPLSTQPIRLSCKRSWKARRGTSFVYPVAGFFDPVVSALDLSLFYVSPRSPEVGSSVAAALLRPLGDVRGRMQAL